jgi:hypothetical protein
MSGSKCQELEWWWWNSLAAEWPWAGVRSAIRSHPVRYQASLHRTCAPLPLIKRFAADLYLNEDFQFRSRAGSRSGETNVPRETVPDLLEDPTASKGGRRAGLGVWC